MPPPIRLYPYDLTHKPPHFLAIHSQPSLPDLCDMFFSGSREGPERLLRRPPDASEPAGPDWSDGAYNRNPPGTTTTPPNHHKERFAYREASAHPTILHAFCGGDAALDRGVCTLCVKGGLAGFLH